IHYGAIEDLEHALNLHGERDAVFLVEPVLRDIVVPPSGYLARGLGRTDKVLCCKHDQIRPNIVLLGKAL
ncbi:hypothetical protein SCLCIDRAFT_62255, partial [Scleroderma citrinum Foug A]